MARAASDSSSVRVQLQRDTTRLALRDGRRVGQPGHEEAKQFLLARLAEIGLQPFRERGFELPFGPPPLSRDLGMANLVGVVPGRNRLLPPLLVGAHYDSAIDGPSADDNATAVAVVLAAAERFVARPLQRDLIVAIFDAEEPPYFLGELMGSTRFVSDHCAGMQFACAVIMDLIGHDVEFRAPTLGGMLPDLANLLVVTGCESAAHLPAVVSDSAATQVGLTILPTHTEHVGDMSDYAVFRQNGQPFLFLTCGQGCYYHHPQDDLGWINFDKVERTAEFVGQLLPRIDAACPEHPAGPADTFELECRSLQRLLGPAWQPLLAAVGLSAVTTRAELRQLATVFRGSLIA